MSPYKIQVGSAVLANDLPLGVIAGPCVIEGQDHALKMAESLMQVTQKLGLGFIYKSSFDKANRTSLTSERGIGLEEGLSILEQVRSRIGCAVLTDVHESAQCEVVSKSVDALQIPAFLCRQTDLLLAAGRTGKPIVIKKGQFLAPWDMSFVLEKVTSTGNRQILLCERGITFGYNNLVCDFRSLPILAATGYPIIFDATHSVQLPGGKNGTSGGELEFVSVLARAAVAVGVAAVFLETHQDPVHAPSDGATMVPLQNVPKLLETLFRLDKLSKELSKP